MSRAPRFHIRFVAALAFLLPAVVAGAAEAPTSSAAPGPEHAAGAPPAVAAGTSPRVSQAPPAALDPPPPPPRGPAAMSPEDVRKDLAEARDIYRAIVAYHPLLQGQFATAPVVAAALADVTRYTAELDERVELAPLFFADDDALAELCEIAARAHLQAALLAARGVDLDLSMTQYDRATALLGRDPADWDVRLEREGLYGTLPGAAEATYRMATAREIVDDLKRFWAAGSPTRFVVRGYSTDERRGLRLERLSGGSDAFTAAVFQLAEERFRERAAGEGDELTVTLPPGAYRVLTGQVPRPRETTFVVSAAGVPDPIVLSPARFHFELADPSSPCRPELALNGTPVTDLRDLPYGTYRVTATSRRCRRPVPEKIVVEERPYATTRTEPDRLEQARDGQPIFLFITAPPGSTVTLRL